MKTLFITGTDTGVGKTRVACALLRAATSAGVAACAYKPVATGCVNTPEGLRSEDALALQAAAGMVEPYASVNPYAFEPPIAPHLAAARAGVRIDRAVLDAGHDALADGNQLVVVEGAGGWQVPLGDDLGFADWVGSLGWPVVLVVAVRLGCLNHALLSVESITQRTRLAGWVANHLQPADEVARANVQALRERLPAPLLGEIEFGCDGTSALAWPRVAEALRAER
jgi:dethiobiotin synthetase